mmetsp:Transcript_61160/g.143083  ORF Transcript_61160/g.143083 Transcript_61160/m.143083 type:complete len:99 (+) Transcript_61160:499-795(+)
MHKRRQLKWNKLDVHVPTQLHLLSSALCLVRHISKFIAERYELQQLARRSKRLVFIGCVSNPQIFGLERGCRTGVTHLPPDFQTVLQVLFSSGYFALQ